MSARELITDHLDLWTGAVTTRSTAGRGRNGKVELTGIKKLRELILELAVRGKLVEQDPDDESASVLLERIAKEKARLVKEGKIRKPRKLPPLSDNNKPFSLPERWEWTQIEAIGHDWGQKEPDQDFSYIDVSAIDNIKGLINQPETVSPNSAPSRARKKVRPGTVIYSTVRPYLQNIAVVEKLLDPEPIASTAFAIVSPLCGTPSRFLLHYLRSPVFIRYVESVQTGIAYPAINDKQFFSGALPVPPLQEQHRIVEKVDEMMALCDRLEQQAGDQLEAHEVLVDTLLDALNRSADAAELAENWGRITEHFDTLFTTDASIDNLKQTILQLAVMGRLVPQDSSYESARVLLDSIAKEKARLVKEGRIKKSKKLLSIAEDEKPFQLPNSWEWCRFPDVGELARGKSKHRPRNDPLLYQNGTVPLIQTGDVARADREITTYTALYNEHGVAQSKLWPPGTLCITIAANIGDTGLLQFEACFPDSVVGFTPFDEKLKNEYFEYFLRTAKRRLEEFAPATAQKNINLDVLQNIIVPLPPAMELNRIVAKVDELMALCDQLKARLGEAGETKIHLAEAVVDASLS